MPFARIASSRSATRTATAHEGDQLGVGLIYVNPWMEQALLLVVFERYPDRSDLKGASWNVVRH